MNPIEFTPDQLKQWFSGKYWHPTHDEVTELAAKLRVHADGVFPDALITERRPHESLAVQEYRKKIWQPVTKPYFGKVLASLAKIRRSTEWSVKFGEAPNRIPEGESLEDYLMTRFPRFTSLTNWAFSLLLREYAVDSNAWVAVMPTEEQVQENEFLKPEPIIFRSEQIIDYADEFLVVLSDEKVSYKVGDFTRIDGDRYYIITDTEYQRWDQVDGNRKFALTWVHEHSLGQLPAFQMRGMVVRSTGAVTVNESRMAPMLPRLDEAAREYSDLQAEVVQHVHSEKWEVGEAECITCNGKKTVTLAGFGNSVVSCDHCHGTGWEPRGPYTTMMISKGMAGEQGTPTPPMGYIQKDTNIVEVQDRRVNDHIFHALAAVNMQHVMNTPMAESGIAKAYDADETNNFAHAVAEDIVAMLDNVAYLTNELRNAVVIPDTEARESMLPEIAVPERFDLFSAQMVEQELSNAKDKKVNPVILNAMEIQYAVKKFSADTDVRDRLSLVLSLDPLPNITEEDKVMRLQNGGITKETYIVSCNILAFITRAIDEKGTAFFDMELKDQKALMLQYATEQVNAGSMEKQILSEMLPETAGMFKVGDNVMVIPGKEHMPIHKGVTMSIAEAQGKAYALTQPDGAIHKWYMSDELMSAVSNGPKMGM